MLEFLDLQYAIRGDGEAALVEFVKRLESKIPLKGLEGLSNWFEVELPAKSRSGSRAKQ
jgi:hypothetical protein